jgi:hypothetical protein
MNLLNLNEMLNIVSLTESNFSNPRFVADFILATLFVLLFTGLLCFIVKRLAVLIVFGVLDLLFIIATAVNLPYLSYTFLAMISVSMIIILFINSGILRKYIGIPLKSNSKKNDAQTESEKEKMIKDICEAVKWLSDNKTGALITFERNTPLNIDNGTKINCPITPEIIETIFYEGTRLHDGAIIIRGNVIVAAGVFFEPSTKAINGKFGSRHRAALGISEVSDSVTIVVSEETGRVMIAHGGIMDSVKMMEFEKFFRNRIA